jgi:hypothetical protein
MDLQDYDWDRLHALGFTEEATGSLKKACWSGYTAIGMKNKNGRKVPNCVKVKSDAEHKEGDVATAEMTPNYLPKEPIPGGGDLKNPQMGEQKIRMPRSDVIKKASSGNGALAMRAEPNYGEAEDFSELLSDERNGRMIVNQLRVIREKTDTLLGMLDGSENLPPWCFVKITNAGTGLASVADYLKYGDEFV